MAEQAPLPDPKIPLIGIVGTGRLATSMVHQWIEMCNMNHPKCQRRTLQRPDHPPFSRIIDVGSEDQSPRLVEDKDFRRCPIYVTLSHCWGKVQPLELNSSNLDDLKKEIPWQKLPKTFADAIQFSRSIGVEFLWIDSLCIKQDSNADWEQQAKAMGDIYRSSYLNIAATGAVDSNGGLFHKRDESSIPPLRVFIPKISRLTPRSGSYFRYYDATVDSMWQREVEQRPLCGRAWVVQERILPRRCLHFCERQLYWECPTLSACETFPHGLLRAMDDTISFKAYDPLQPNLLNSTGTFETGRHQGSPAFLSIWGRLVEVFTSAGITYSTDKLAAIAGMAKLLARTTKLEYFAGSWNCDIPNQLLWRTSKPSERREKDRAPSWSWASVNSPVLWHFNELERTRITVQYIQEKHKISQFKQFEAEGQLEIRGDLVPGILHSDTGGPVRLILRGSLDAEFYPDIVEDNLGAVLCTTICYSTEWYSPNHLELSYKGLVLRRTGKKGVLERLGLFTSKHRVEWVYDLDRNIRLLDYTNFPSKIYPLEGVNEDSYIEYIDIDDGGGVTEEINERSFYSILTLAEASAMEKPASGPQEVVEKQPDHEPDDGDEEMLDNEEMPDDEEMLDIHEKASDRPTIKVLHLYHRRAAEEEKVRESKRRTYGAFIFYII